MQFHGGFLHFSYIVIWDGEFHEGIIPGNVSLVTQAQTFLKELMRTSKKPQNALVLFNPNYFLFTIILSQHLTFSASVSNVGRAGGLWCREKGQTAHVQMLFDATYTLRSSVNGCYVYLQNAHCLLDMSVDFVRALHQIETYPIILLISINEKACKRMKWVQGKRRKSIADSEGMGGPMDSVVQERTIWTLTSGYSMIEKYHCHYGSTSW